MDALGLYPDDLTVGDVTAAFFVKNENDDSETEFGPYTLTSKTDMHFAGRRARVRWTGATNTAWRVGTPALELVPVMAGECASAAAGHGLRREQ
jgi:CHASE1-domain containing sensor protein